MSKRQVIILWSLAALLAILVLVVKLFQQDTSKSTTNRNPGQTLFESFPAKDVTEIEITGTGKSTVLRKDTTGWIVANRDQYPANTQNVHEFIRTLEELKITQAIEAGASFAPRFGMDENATTEEARGITAIFRNAKGGEIARVSLGKPIESATENPLMGGRMSVGRYIRNHADGTGFYASDEMFPTASNDPARWLKDDFIAMEKIQSITLSKKDSKDIDWSIQRETEEANFQLVGAAAGEVANETNVSPLKSLFSYTRFDDVVPKESIAERAASSGTRTATIKTFEGFTYVLTITPAKNSGGQYLMTLTIDATLPTERKKAEGEPEAEAKAKDEAFTKRLKELQDKLAKEKTFVGRTYEISPSTIDTLLKERADMVTKATPTQEPATAPATVPPMLAPNPR